MSHLHDRLASSLSGQYSLERELGGGGMSRVFVAEETALGRKVVVKVLSPELAEGLSGDRFIREIKVAARLQQANIVPVLRAGELDGLPYYTMPFVTGESLRSRIVAGPITSGDAIAILRDVAKALAYAHAEGVVHRDIKPENVLLSSGTAVVTDFGIAKAISVSRAERDTNATNLTGLGISLGTPAYMAPEQAAGDPDIDARADLYSWGVLAYELLAGRHPFARHRAVHDLIRAHMTEMPEHLGVLAPGAPIAVTNLVMQCLAKSPAERPATAAELVGALDPSLASGSIVTTRRPLGVVRALAVYFGVLVVVAGVMKLATTLIGLPAWAFGASIGVMALGLPVVLLTALVERQRSRHVTSAPTSGTIARLAVQYPRRFTWKRTTVGGVLAFGALTAIVVGYMGMRNMGIGPFGSLIGSKALAVKDRIVIGDMRGPASDSGLGAVLAEGIRTGLVESKALRIVSAERANMILEQMRKPGAPVTGTVAREVAERSGAKAILDGDVQRVGAAYVLTVRLNAIAGGEPLVTLQETAESDVDFTPATGRLAKRLRERVGESLRSVNSAPGLAGVTTSSLPALRKYTEGVLAYNRGDFLGTMRLAKEAVAIDSGFASAYMLMGSQIARVSGMRQTQSAYLAKAYANRARATERERLAIESAYWMDGPEQDFAKAQATANAAFALDEGFAELAAWLTAAAGDYQRAIRLSHQALEYDSSSVNVYYVLVTGFAELGQMDSAVAALSQFGSVAPLHPMGLVLAPQLAVMTGNDSAAMATALMMEGSTTSPLAMEWGAAIKFALLHRAGRLREANREYDRYTALRAARGIVGQGSMTGLRMAADRASLLGDKAGASRIIDSTLRAFPIEAGAQRDRLHNDVAVAAFHAGRIDLLKRALEGQKRDDPLVMELHGERFAVSMQALIDQSEGRYAQAIENIRAAYPSPRRMQMGDLAFAFDAAGQKDSARVYLEKFVSSTSLDLTIWDESRYLARARKRLGELYEERGDVDKAYGQYAAFVNQWKRADPELQPVVQTVAARMKALDRIRAK